LDVDGVAGRYALKTKDIGCWWAVLKMLNSPLQASKAWCIYELVATAKVPRLEEG